MSDNLMTLHETHLKNRLEIVEKKFNDCYGSPINQFIMNVYSGPNKIIEKQMTVTGMINVHGLSFVETGERFDLKEFAKFITSLEKYENAYFSFSEMDGTENFKFTIAGPLENTYDSIFEFTIHYYTSHLKSTVYLNAAERKQWADELSLFGVKVQLLCKLSMMNQLKTKVELLKSKAELLENKA